ARRLPRLARPALRRGPVPDGPGSRPLDHRPAGETGRIRRAPPAARAPPPPPPRIRRAPPRRPPRHRLGRRPSRAPADGGDGDGGAPRKARGRSPPPPRPTGVARRRSAAGQEASDLDTVVGSALRAA